MHNEPSLQPACIEGLRHQEKLDASIACMMDLYQSTGNEISIRLFCMHAAVLSVVFAFVLYGGRRYLYPLLLPGGRAFDSFERVYLGFVYIQLLFLAKYTNH